MLVGTKLNFEDMINIRTVFLVLAAVSPVVISILDEEIKKKEEKEKNKE